MKNARRNPPMKAYERLIRYTAFPTASAARASVRPPEPAPRVPCTSGTGRARLPPASPCASAAPRFPAQRRRGNTARTCTGRTRLRCTNPHVSPSVAPPIRSRSAAISADCPRSFFRKLFITCSSAVPTAIR